VLELDSLPLSPLSVVVVSSDDVVIVVVGFVVCESLDSVTGSVIVSSVVPGLVVLGLVVVPGFVLDTESVDVVGSDPFDVDVPALVSA
jgi:hypothetical protein